MVPESENTDYLLQILVQKFVRTPVCRSHWRCGSVQRIFIAKRYAPRPTRGELWRADFGIPFSGEPGFRRPVLIVQDDGYTQSRLNTVVVVPLTTNLLLEEAPGNVFLSKEESSLAKGSVIVVTQRRAPTGCVTMPLGQ